MHKQDEAALQKEIAGSRALLEERLNTAVTTFAYPFGVSTEHIRALVEGAGYRTARGLRPGTTHTPADRFDLRSYLVRDDVQDTVYFLEHTL
jgi:hypothetical protein